MQGLLSATCFMFVSARTLAPCTPPHLAETLSDGESCGGESCGGESCGGESCGGESGREIGRDETVLLPFARGHLCWPVAPLVRQMRPENTRFQRFVRTL